MNVQRRISFRWKLSTEKYVYKFLLLLENKNKNRFYDDVVMRKKNSYILT